MRAFIFFLFFFFNDTATTEIYTLSLHDALPICDHGPDHREHPAAGRGCRRCHRIVGRRHPRRSEEHTSELQSQSNLVCRLLLEKKKKKTKAENILITKRRNSTSYRTDCS